MSMTSLDGIKSKLAAQLQGIERYNPGNIATLESYVEMQAKENDYDLEANLALLKLYQFNPQVLNGNLHHVSIILLKSLTNLPASDFLLCKSLLPADVLESEESSVRDILVLTHLLETCQFKEFWSKVHNMRELVRPIAGFHDSIRKFVCHVISITYQRISEANLSELLGLVDENALNQWISKNGWKHTADKNYILVSNQEESIKTKKITEKIDLESVGGIMASCL